jgi:hypothetical protein
MLANFAFAVGLYMRNNSFVYAPKEYKNDKQTDMYFHSTNKDMSVWDGAGWQGCGFVFNQLETCPPIFGLAFENIERGKQVVEEWKARLQVNEPAVVIYIVRGVNKNNPTWYRICVAPDVKFGDSKEKRYCTTMCRKHTMTPTTNTNLDNFERLFNLFGYCWFKVFAIDSEKQIVMPLMFDDAFIFNKIEFRNAWEIGHNDFAKIALEIDDEPFIPEEKKDSAPIIEVMNDLRKISRYNKSLINKKFG